MFFLGKLRPTSKMEGIKCYHLPCYIRICGSLRSHGGFPQNIHLLKLCLITTHPFWRIHHSLTINDLMEAPFFVIRLSLDPLEAAFSNKRLFHGIDHLTIESSEENTPKSAGMLKQKEGTKRNS